MKCLERHNSSALFVCQNMPDYLLTCQSGAEAGKWQLATLRLDLHHAGAAPSLHRAGCFTFRAGGSAGCVACGALLSE